MRITGVRVFNVEGETHSGNALYEIARAGLVANEVTPYSGTSTQVETDGGCMG